MKIEDPYILLRYGIILNISDPEQIQTYLQNGLVVIQVKPIRGIARYIVIPQIRNLIDLLNLSLATYNKLSVIMAIIKHYTQQNKNIFASEDLAKIFKMSISNKCEILNYLDKVISESICTLGRLPEITDEIRADFLQNRDTYARKTTIISFLANIENLLDDLKDCKSKTGYYRIKCLDSISEKIYNFLETYSTLSNMFGISNIKNLLDYTFNIPAAYSLGCDCLWMCKNKI